MRLRGWLMAGLTAVALAGCAANTTETDASPQEVAQAIYRHDGPPAITLYTMINNRSGAGAHSSLMINGSQRVIFDPAGSVRHSAVPEVNDVLYGITPRIADFYARAHARKTFHVVIQRIEVSPEVAERALQLAQTTGPVAQSFCAQSTSGILQQLPGFEGIRSTFFPRTLADQLEGMPGVQTTRLYEEDADDKQLAIDAFSPGQPATGQSRGNAGGAQPVR